MSGEPRFSETEMTDKERVERYISVLPSARQKTVQEHSFNTFIHYGINTFTGKEWGDGTAPASLFAPTAQDTDDWVRCAKSAGAAGVILTCKHHDGFCLWQTDTTDYSVRSSPYKDGKGDVVAEVAESCRKFGLKFGIYLSPWDRNSKFYGTDEYNDFYVRQLTELLTRYGDIFCVWLDGACGSYMDGRPCQRYDFERYYAVVRELQPGACISNCGPDIRWVGNEAGVTRPAEWNVVPAALADPYKAAAASQSEDAPFETKLGAEDEDLGSRTVLERCGELIWYPAEADVSIRPGWFFHDRQNRKVKSAEKLLSLWYKTVGGNCMLLLNVPPDRRGRIYEKDAATLRELGERLKSAFAAKAECEDESLPSFEPAQSYAVTRKFTSPQRVDKAVVAEDIRFSQRVEKFALYALCGGVEKKVYEGTTIGHLKVALFEPTLCDGLKLEIASSRLEPHLERFDAYLTDGKPHPKERFAALKRWVTRVNYKMYLFMQELAKKTVKKS